MAQPAVRTASRAAQPKTELRNKAFTALLRCAFRRSRRPSVTDASMICSFAETTCQRNMCFGLSVPWEAAAVRRTHSSSRGLFRSADSFVRVLLRHNDAFVRTRRPCSLGCGYAALCASWWGEITGELLLLRQIPALPTCRDRPTQSGFGQYASRPQSLQMLTDRNPLRSNPDGIIREIADLQDRFGAVCVRLH